MNVRFDSRIQALREAMAAESLDGLLVCVGENRRYLSGFTAEDHQFDESCGVLIVTRENLLLATDSRFELQAHREADGFEVHIYKKAFHDELPDLLTRLGIRRMGFESERVSVYQHGRYLESLIRAGCEALLSPVRNIVESLRIKKGPDEIDATRAALNLSETVWEGFLPAICPGMTEKEAAWELERRLREAGADALSFPVIVAAGPNAALPHAVPTDRPFAMGEPLLFDWGIKLDGYCSDTSRTVVLGEPGEKFISVYETVRKAQEAAIAGIKAGVTGKRVDRIARDTIEATEFKGLFGHGLGHGTGLMIHEAPRLSPLSPDTLEEGMICTVEPGIYIEGWGGVRIENQVVVGKDGPLVLNRSDTALKTLGNG